MTISSTTVVWAATTAAQAKAAFQAISSALDAVGVAKTADTGQIDFTQSIVLPGVSPFTSTYAWYEIRQLKVTGLPTLFLRVDYGVSFPTGTVSTNRPTFKITVGTQTDGAGNLGGIVNNFSLSALASYTSSVNPYPNNPSTVARPLNVASDGANYLTIMIDPTGQVTSDVVSKAIAAFTLERTITPGDGTYNGNGWVQYDAGGRYRGAASASVGDPNSGYSITSILSAFTVHTWGNIPSQTCGTLFSSSGSGNSASLFPITVMIPVPQGPMQSAIIYFDNDVVPGVQFQATLYGEVHNYFALGQNAASSVNCNPANSAIYSPALRFE